LVMSARMMATMGGTSAQKVKAIWLLDVMTPVPPHTEHSSPFTRPVPPQVVQVMLRAGASVALPPSARAKTVSADATRSSSSSPASHLRDLYISHTSKKYREQAKTVHDTKESV
jgi:hypothetical protein